MNYLKDGARVVAQSAEPILFDAARGGFFVVEQNAVYSQPGLTAENAPSVPQEVSRRQMMLALNQLGLLASIKAFVATQPMEIQIGFDESTKFLRDDADLNRLAKSPPMSMTDEQLDGVFVLAGTF